MTTSITEPTPAPSQQQNQQHNNLSNHHPKSNHLIQAKLMRGWTLYNKRSCYACGTPLLNPPGSDQKLAQGDIIIPWCVTDECHVVTEEYMLPKLEQMQERWKDFGKAGKILVDFDYILDGKVTEKSESISSSSKFTFEDFRPLPYHSKQQLEGESSNTTKTSKKEMMGTRALADVLSKDDSEASPEKVTSIENVRSQEGFELDFDAFNTSIHVEDNETDDFRKELTKEDEKVVATDLNEKDDSEHPILSSSNNNINFNESEILDEETASIFAQKRTEALEQMAQEELQAERLRLQQINREVENKRQIELARKQEEEKQKAEEEKLRFEQSKRELEERARDAALQAEDAVKKEAEHQEAMKAISEALGTKDTDDTVVSRLTKEATERSKKADRATDLANAALKQIESLQSKVQQDAIREYSEGAVREMDISVQVSDGKKIEMNDLTKDLGKQVEVNLLNVKLNEELEKYNKTQEEPKDLTEEEKISLALTAEQWEERRSKSRALITSLMIDNWSMITDYCKGKHCRYSPLMCKDGVTQCVVCDGTGTGKDGCYRFEPAEINNVEESVQKAKTEAPDSIKKSPVVTVEAEKPVVQEKNLFAERLAEATQAQSFEQRMESDIAAPSKTVESVKKVEAPTPTTPAVSQTKPPLSSPPVVNTSSHYVERSPSPSVSSVRSATPSVSSAVKKRIPTSGGGGENESNDTESAEKRTFATKEIGRKMLKGWILLDDACPYCIMPLMTETKGSEHVCVLCGPLEAKHAEVKKQKETEDKIKERMKLEQELIQLKEKEEELKAIRLEEQKKREAALKLEAEKKKAIEESKRMEEEKIKKMISEEVKRREEEIASELLETQTRYSTKASEDVESTKRATEKERLLKERERFANVAKDIKKMEELHKLNPDIPPVPVSPIASPEQPSKTIAQTSNNSTNHKHNMIESESILSKVSVSKRPTSSYTNTNFNDNESVASKVSVAKIDNGDEASTGGVSIQFPPDFDYDDEDAIRQVIAMARSTRAKSSAVASVNSGNTPPMSIFVEKKNNNVASPMKRTSNSSSSPAPGNLISKHIMSEPKMRKPMIPPSSSSVRSFAVEQDFDDGVSHITMGTSFAASSTRVGSYMNKTNNKFTGGSPLSDLQENSATSTSNMNMMTPPINRRRSRSITRDTPPPPPMVPSSSSAAGRRSEALRKSSELLSRIDQHFASSGSLSGGVPPSSRSRSVSRSRRVTTSNSRSNSIDRRSSSLSRRRPSVGSSSRVISNMPDEIMNMKTKYSNNNNLVVDDDAGSVGAGSVSSRVSAASQNLNDILKQIESAKSQLSKTTSTPKYSSYSDTGNKSVATSNSKGGGVSNIMSKLEHAKMIEKLAADAVKIDNFEDEEFGL